MTSADNKECARCHSTDIVVTREDKDVRWCKCSHCGLVWRELKDFERIFNLR